MQINYKNPLARSVKGMTVREFSAMLAALPEELQEHTISCMGLSDFYLIIRPNEKVLQMEEKEFIEE